MRTRTMWRLARLSVLAAAACFAACGGDDVTLLPLFDGGVDAAITSDASFGDAGTIDSGELDAAPVVDAGTDAGHDAGSDAGRDSGTPDGRIDAGQDAGFDSGADASVDAGGDAGDDAGDAAVVVKGCTTFSDQSGTSGTRVVQGPSGSAPVQYSPNCIQISAGQTVTFQQHAFSEHPLEPAGGDTGNPILFTSTGTTTAFTFSTAGTYGFECEFHPLMMFGAVKVVP